VWERVRRSGYAGLRTDAHWTRLLASDVVPGDLAGHLQHHYAVWRQAAAQVRALDLTLGEQARALRDVVRRLETVPGVGPIVAPLRPDLRPAWLQDRRRGRCPSSVSDSLRDAA
jgi:hypothetical protein